MTTLAHSAPTSLASPAATAWLRGPALDGDLLATRTADQAGRLPRMVCATLVLGTSGALWWGAAQIVGWLLA